MSSTVELDDAEKLDTYTADGRGRVTLGQKYAGKEVRVAFSVKQDGEDNNDE